MHDRPLCVSVTLIDDFGPRDEVFQRQANKVHAAREAIRQSQEGGGQVVAAQAAFGSTAAQAPAAAMAQPMAQATGRVTAPMRARFPTIVTDGGKPAQPGK